MSYLRTRERRFGIIAAGLVALLLTIGACDKSGSALTGNWMGGPDAPDFKVVELLPDKTARVIDVQGMSIAGTWSKMPDGVVQIAFTAFGTNMVANGTVEADSMVIVWENQRNVLRRAASDR